MSTGTQIQGHVEVGFGEIADEFAKGCAGLRQTGAALAVAVKGRLVVDIWGGMSDARSGAAWREDTIGVVFSCTKGLVAICALNLVAEGRLDLDAPVVTYWPEFGRFGKEKILVRWLLEHRAGLIALDVDLTVDDLLNWDPVIRALEAQTPIWTPGSGHRYHTLTYGWLVGEVIRRITGMSIGQYLRSLTAARLAPNTWIGLPVEEESRVTHHSWEDEQDGPTAVLGLNSDASERRWIERSSTLGGALPLDLVCGDSGFNDPHLHRAEIPGAGGISTARDLALIWSSTVTFTNGVQLLSREITDAASVPASYGEPIFGGQPPYGVWGTGFSLPSIARPLLSRASYGHDGLGGQRGFADPDAAVGFGYVTNHLVQKDDRRADVLVAKLRKILGS